MNDFYKQKATLPRQVKNSNTLYEALENWRDYRLNQVANACLELDDPFRQEFGKFHLELINTVNILLEEKNLQKASKEWYSALKEDFEKITVFNKGGGRINALGICGAELNQILNMDLG